MDQDRAGRMAVPAGETPMNKTGTPYGPINDIEPWAAMMLLQSNAMAKLIAQTLFTTPHYLRCRLGYGGQPAFCAARHVQAAVHFLSQAGKLPPAGEKLSSRHR